MLESVYIDAYYVIEMTDSKKTVSTNPVGDGGDGGDGGEREAGGTTVVESKAEKWFKQLNYQYIVTKAQIYFAKGKEFYSQNKKIGDLSLSFLCCLAVIFGWVDLGRISTLYLLGLVYMTAKAIANFYKRIGSLPKPEVLSQLANKEVAPLDVAPSLFNYLELLDRNSINESMHEFVTVGNNWMLYASLVLCDKVILGLSYCMSGFLFGPLLSAARFFGYMYFNNFFVKILEPHSETVGLSIVDWTPGDAKHNKSIPTPTRYLISFMAMNNMASHFVCGKINLEILRVISKGSSKVVEALSGFWTQFSMKNPGVSELSTAAGVASTAAVKTSKGFFKSATEKFKSWRKSA